MHYYLAATNPISLIRKHCVVTQRSVMISEENKKLTADRHPFLKEHLIFGLHLSVQYSVLAAESLAVITHFFCSLRA